MNALALSLAAAAKFNHLSFPTHDVPATAAFFETYLGFTVSMGGSTQFAILKRPGLDVVIEHASPDAPTIQALGGAVEKTAGDVDSNDGGEVAWPQSFHIGLEFPTVDDLGTLLASMREDGFEASTGIFNNGRGSRFFLRAPGGVLVEFNTRSDAAARYRGTFDN